jgi:hypothetical protein
MNQKTERPTIVVLCGSTRFWRDYLEWNDTLSRAGKIVLSVGCYVHANVSLSDGSPGIRREVTPEEKRQLDQLHLRKIDMADEVLILNRNGYMGESTRAELEYARAAGKIIRFVEPLSQQDRQR